MISYYRFFLVICCLAVYGLQVNAQTFERVEIGESGCSAEFPATPTLNFKTDENNNRIWSGAVRLEGTRYGILCMEFAEPKLDLTRSGLSSWLLDYLEGLKERFGIVATAGTTTDLELDSNPLATGISESWTTEDLTAWRIRAWIDPYHMAFLYGYGESGLPDLQILLVYLDSFRFPE